MSKDRWNKCPYFAEGQCPHGQIIDRAYLIPQLLEASELEKAVRVCGECGQYLAERRKHTRLKKPFKSIIHKEHEEVPIAGNILNVSEMGILVRLEDWSPFDINEKIQIEIHPRHNSPEKLDNEIIRTSGEVKRVDSKTRQLALMFSQAVDQHALHAL